MKSCTLCDVEHTEKGNWCLSCKEKKKNYRLQHLDAFKKYGQTHYEKNKDTLLTKNKAYRDRNPEAVKKTEDARAKLKETYHHRREIGVCTNGCGRPAVEGKVFCFECRDRHRERRYGFKPGEIDKLLEKQGGLCAICDKPPKQGSCLYVDHNHDTNEIRQLLCFGCNCAIGHLNESPEVAKSASIYLSKHNRKADMKRYVVKAIYEQVVETTIEAGSPIEAALKAEEAGTEWLQVPDTVQVKYIIKSSRPA